MFAETTLSRSRGAFVFRLAVFVVLLGAARQSTAATFIVPPDRDMVRQATAIVIASALTSRTELRDDKAIETITTMSVEEVLKGPISGDTFEVYEPGGVYQKRVTTIPGIPRFTDGERYVLFLMQYKGTWRVLNLVLGKFTFEIDISGHEILLRDASEIHGWDQDGKWHQEVNRSAEPFLNFIRGSVAGGPARANYNIPAEPVLRASVSAQQRGLRPSPLCVFPCSPTSYTYIYTLPLTGVRWNSFPTTYYSKDANAAAITAMNAAIASWNNDASSNVNIVNGGADPGNHTGGISTADGQSTIWFERSMAPFGGTSPISCTGSSYSGNPLGVGLVSNDGGPHIGPNGETFRSAVEGDVEMNQGTSTCTYFIGLGDFNSAVAHEIGHTLGFRHSDENRVFSGPSPCNTDATLECSTTAIMKAFIPSTLNGALQSYDQHAVDTVYPNSALVAPTGVSASVLSASSIRVTWTTNGAPTYRIYRIVNGAYTLAGTKATSPFDDGGLAADTAYLYAVRAFDGAASESTDGNHDLASTTIFTALAPQVSVVMATDITKLRTLVNSVQTIAGSANTAYTDPTLNSSVTIKKAHIDELVFRLNAAKTALSLSGVSLSAGPITQFVTPVRASDVNDLRNALQ